MSNTANSQSINPYSYIGNNPLSGVDPTGYDPDYLDQRRSLLGECELQKCQNIAMNPGTNEVKTDDAGGGKAKSGADGQGSQQANSNPTNQGNPQQTAQQSKEDAASAHVPAIQDPANDKSLNQRDEGGFFQKLGNLIRGGGWKTDQELIADQRQWLIESKVQRGSAGGDLSPVDWSRASDEAVRKAYDYIQQVRTATNVNHELSKAGLPLVVTYGHGWRHIEADNRGLTQAEVQDAIRQHVEGTVKASSDTGSWYGRVNVRGNVIECRAWTLPDGTIKVGTYYYPRLPRP